MSVEAKEKWKQLQISNWSATQNDINIYIKPCVNQVQHVAYLQMIRPIVVSSLVNVRTDSVGDCSRPAILWDFRRESLKQHSNVSEGLYWLRILHGNQGSGYHLQASPQHSTSISPHLPGEEEAEQRSTGSVASKWVFLGKMCILADMPGIKFSVIDM